MAALKEIINPAIEKTTKANAGTGGAGTKLVEAFAAVENVFPGSGLIFLKEVLNLGKSPDSVKEMLEGFEMAQRMVKPPEITTVIQLGEALVAVLGTLEAQIEQRQTFLVAIKKIAGAIKEFLDNLNSPVVARSVPSSMRSVLDGNRRNFIQSSKSFSDTLKGYFKDESTKSIVFDCGVKLAKETAVIVDILR